MLCGECLEELHILIVLECALLLYDVRDLCDDALAVGKLLAQGIEGIYVGLLAVSCRDALASPVAIGLAVGGVEVVEVSLHGLSLGIAYSSWCDPLSYGSIER